MGNHTAEPDADAEDEQTGLTVWLSDQLPFWPDLRFLLDAIQEQNLPVHWDLIEADEQTDYSLLFASEEAEALLLRFKTVDDYAEVLSELQGTADVWQDGRAGRGADSIEQGYVLEDTLQTFPELTDAAEMLNTPRRYTYFVPFPSADTDG